MTFSISYIFIEPIKVIIEYREKYVSGYLFENKWEVGTNIVIGSVSTFDQKIIVFKEPKENFVK